MADARIKPVKVVLNKLHGSIKMSLFIFVSAQNKVQTKTTPILCVVKNLSTPFLCGLLLLLDFLFFLIFFFLILLFLLLLLFFLFLCVIVITGLLLECLLYEQPWRQRHKRSSLCSWESY